VRPQLYQLVIVLRGHDGIVLNRKLSETFKYDGCEEIDNH